MLEKVKATISYDGTNFSGFQIQPYKRTVQEELEKALKIIHKKKHIRIQASGRTDAGVHAKGQVIHFETPNNIPESNWKKALNVLLPSDVYVRRIEKVSSSFHARYDATEKEYRYFVCNEKEVDVFMRNYAYLVPGDLNLIAMKKACYYLRGEHDFTTFSSAKATTRGSKVRTLYKASCENDGSEIAFAFRGTGFLYNMVRIIVGALLDVGKGKLAPDDIKVLLERKDRRLLGETAPPQGLYLWNVWYG